MTSANLPVTSPPDYAAVRIADGALTVAATVSTNGTCPGQEVVNVLAGTPIKWCYVVTNTGVTTLSNVTVTDDEGQVPGTPATLAPKASITFSRSDVSDYDVTYTAQAKGTVTTVNKVVLSDRDPAAVNVVGPRIDIDVTVSTDGTCPGVDTTTVLAGTGVHYCYKVTNVGDDNLTDIDVMDDITGDNLGEIASLVPGQSTMLSGPQVTIMTDVQHPVTAIGTDIYGFGVTAADLAKVHALLPTISVEKTVSTNGTCPGVEAVTVLSGSNVTYCYTAINTGSAPLTNVTVTDENGVTVNVGDLAPHASGTASATVSVTTDSNTLATATGVYAPTGAAITSRPDGASVDVVSPALSVQKTVSITGGCPGTEIVRVLPDTQVIYCYEVTNTGDTPVSNVVVVDDGATIAIGDIGPGQTGNGGQVLSIPSDTDTTAVAFGTTTATGTYLESPPDGAAVDVIHPSISIAKTASTDGACPGVESVTVLEGTPVTYCYAVTNTGDTAIERIDVVDNGVTLLIGDLAPGQTGHGSRDIAASGDETTPALSNGTVTATQTPVQSPQDDASVKVVHPALTISKTVSLDGTCPGSEIVTVLANTGVTYCYTVTNSGDTTVSGVTVIDDGISVVIGDLGRGESGSGTAVVSIATDTNTPAVASGTTVATGTPVLSPPDRAGVDVVAPSLTIEKTVSQNGTCPGSELVTVLDGASVTYCYHVTNNGDTPVSGVVVNDNGVAVSVGDLGPGQSGNGATTVTVVGDTSSTATASGSVPATGGSVTSPPDGAAVDVVHPALVIQKTVSTSGSCPGVERVTVLGNTQVTYCYAVTNTGDTLVTGVTVNDAGVAVSIGDLGPGQSGSGTTTFTALGDTSTTAVANGTTAATGTPVASPPDGAEVDVVTPALSISTTVSTNGTCPGQEVVNVLAGTAVTWCYTVTNTGDTAVNGVVVTDNQYGRVPGATFALEPGASNTLSLNVPANVDVTATASATGLVPVTGTPVVSPQDPAVVNVVSPNIDIDVTVSTDGACPGVDSVSVPAGTSVIYCYKVTNNGDDTLADVTVNDVAGNVIGSLSDLVPGESTVLASDPQIIQGNGTIEATASGTDAYGFPVSDSDTALVHALFAKLSIQKTVSLDGTCPGVERVTVLSGAAATYCYLVTNTGDTAVVNVEVRDDGHIVAAGNLTPGQSTVVSRSVTATADEDTFAAAFGTNPFSHQPVASAEDDAAIDVVHPSLSIEKTASLDGTCPGAERVSVLQGTGVTYCYVVTNTGDTTVGDIAVDDATAHVTVGTLTAGQSVTVTSTITAGAADIDTPAQASGTDTASWTAVRSPEDDAVVDVIHPALSIATTVSTNGTCPGQEVVNVLSGTSIKWCYVVTNTGDVPVVNVIVTDNVYGAASGGGIALTPGQSITFSRPATATADVTLNGSVTAVDSVLGSPVAAGPDPAVVNVVSPQIDIDVTVRTSGSCPGSDALTVAAGTNVVFCYKVTNTGDDTLTNVVVKNALGQTLQTIGSLAAGATYSFQSAATPINTDATATGTASAVDQYGFPVSDTDTATVHPLFTNLTIAKTAPATLVVDDSNTGCSGTNTYLTYNIVVTNNGQATAAAPVVTDTLPAGLAYVSYTSTSGTCSYSSSAGRVTCTLGNLAAGASATITIKVDVNVTSGTVTNTASVTTTTPETDLSDNSSSATTRISNGATRTIGFYSNHPTFTQACLTSLGGSMNLGWLTLRDEAYDNEIDAAAVGNGPDKDTRKETGMAMVMGLLNANVDHYTNNKKRTALEAAKVQAAKQLIAAICNAQYLGTPPTFSMSGMIQAMQGTDRNLIVTYTGQADAFNNSGDVRSIPMNPGPAVSKYLGGDDPTDPND
ncbi:MAG: DUF11 domain-containing protein [Minicystis sp.]